MFESYLYIHVLLKFAVPGTYELLLLDWYLLGVEMNIGHVAVNFLFQLIFKKE